MLKPILLALWAVLGKSDAAGFGRREGVSSALHDFAVQKGDLPSAADRVMKSLDKLYSAHRRKAATWERKPADACRRKIKEIAASIANPLVVVLAADGGHFSQLLARAVRRATVVTFHGDLGSMRAHTKLPALQGDTIGGVFSRAKLDRLWSLTELFDVLVVSPGVLRGPNLVGRSDQDAMQLVGRLISLSRWTFAVGSEQLSLAKLQQAAAFVAGRMTPYREDASRKIDPSQATYDRKKRKRRHYEFEFGVRKLQVSVSLVSPESQLLQVRMLSTLQQKRHDWDDRAWWKYYSLEVAGPSTAAVVGRLEIRDTVTIPQAAFNLATLLGMGLTTAARVRFLASMLRVPMYPDVDTGNYVLCCAGQLQRIDKGHANAFQNEKKSIKAAFSQFSGSAFLNIDSVVVQHLQQRCAPCQLCDACTWTWSATPCNACLQCAKCILAPKQK